MVAAPRANTPAFAPTQRPRRAASDASTSLNIVPSVPKENWQIASSAMVTRSQTGPSAIATGGAIVSAAPFIASMLRAWTSSTRRRVRRTHTYA